MSRSEKKFEHDGGEGFVYGSAAGTVERSAFAGTNISGGSGGTGTGTDANSNPALPSGHSDGPNTGAPKGRGRWLVIALVSLLFLTILTVAGIVLITRPKATIDQLLIVTVPSGAEVTFDSQSLGHSPVKLEGVHLGHHKLVIQKEGFLPVSKDVDVSENSTLDFKLDPIPPRDAEGLPKEEQLRQYREQAQRAFDEGDLASPYDGRSALYFADLILKIDNTNQFGLEMRDKIRRALLDNAQNAMSRGNLGLAQDALDVLLEYYPDDDAARTARQKLEGQLSLHKGDLRELLRKAQSALQAGNLITPETGSAYYYSRQALAIDRTNGQAKSIRNQIRTALANRADQNFLGGNTEAAMEQLRAAIRLFPDDKQLKYRLNEMQSQQAATDAAAAGVEQRRVRGLNYYSSGNWAEAINDLQFAMNSGQNSPDVVFALGRSYQKMGDLSPAVRYLSQVPQQGVVYRSALGALGEIAMSRGNKPEALQLYKRARDLGGSNLFTVDVLDQKIADIERDQQRLPERPDPFSIPVKHEHGGIFRGSCKGNLIINSTGLRYAGSEHNFASNLVGVGISISGKEITIIHEHHTDKFQALAPDAAEKFKDALVKFQTYANTPR